MKVEEFYKTYFKSRPMKDKFDKKLQLFTYWDMIDFAEQFAELNEKEDSNEDKN